MPIIIKKLNAKIEPRDFLNACDMMELREVDILIRSSEYQRKMRHNESDLETIPEIRKQFILNANRS